MYKKNVLLLLFFVSLFVFSFISKAATLLSDDFTGTTINTSKWNEFDPGGIGGIGGDVQQNGSLTISNSDNGSIGSRALVSVDTFSSDSLEISALITPGGSSMIGYGDRVYNGAGNKAYLVYLAGSEILGLVWNDGGLKNNVSCGSVVSGAIYKIKVITTGFQLYINNSLTCTVNVDTDNLVNDKTIYFQSDGSISTFDNVLVTGNITIDPPTNLITSPASGQISLSWTSPTRTGGSAITDYVIEYKLATEPTIWTTFIDGISTSTSTIVTGLSNGLSYNFRVFAVSSVGSSTVSSVATGTPVYTLLSDDFTGTTINTNKWIEYDIAGEGGMSGNIQQNGSLSVTNSNALGEGTTALVSLESFSANNLEISASLSQTGGFSIFGYGDRLWTESNNKAYFIYLYSGVIMGLAWHNGSYDNSNTNCGIATSGAIYKMKLIETGFEVYKNNILQCTVSPGVENLVNNKPIFLESNNDVTFFDNVLVTGNSILTSVPSAPNIGIAVASDTEATISFTSGTSGGSPIIEYTVTSNPGNITSIGVSSPIKVTGLTNGVEYTFTVTATNAIGTSSSSLVSNAVTPHKIEVPNQVTGLIVNSANRQARLFWVAPYSEAVITDYLIEYKLNTSSVWTVFNDGVSSSTKINVTNLNNDLNYDFRVSAINSVGTGTASIVNSTTPKAINTLAFVITGESNSGGQAPNTNATLEELAPTHEVQIINTNTFLFEDLDIGTNNNMGHTGLTSNTTHGFELELANETKANKFPDNPLIYLVKTGHGGSRLSQWDVGGSYWTQHLQRTAGAKSQLSSDRQWVVWLSLGINDYLAGTTVSDFKTGLIAHINKIKTDLPGCIVILTQFQSMTNGGYATYNTAMGEIATSEPNVYVVDSTGAAMEDGNHWSYTGLKDVGSRMITITNNALGLVYPGIPTNLNANPVDNHVQLSWNAPIANGESNIVDYLIEYKTSNTNTWNIFNDGISIVSSTTVTGLLYSTNYDFRVSAVNSNGSGNTVFGSVFTSSAPINNNVNTNQVSGAVFIPIKNISNYEKKESNLTIIPTSQSVSEIQKIKKDLKFGIINPDVRSLQKFLILQNKGKAAQILFKNGATNYFGDKTKSALIEWQKANNINPSSGYFGPKTRAYIKEKKL